MLPRRSDSHWLIEQCALVLLIEGRAWSPDKTLEYVEACRKLWRLLVPPR